MTLFITIITVCTNLILGLYAYYKKPLSTTHSLFTTITILFSAIAILNFLSIKTGIYFSLPFLLLTIYLFLRTFPYTEFLIKRETLVSLLFVTGIISMLTIMPISIPHIKIGIETIVLVFFSIYCISYGFQDLSKRGKNFTGRQKSQLKIFLLAWVFTILLTISAKFLLQKEIFASIIPIFSLAFTLPIFYSINESRFCSTRYLVERFSLYSVLTIYILLTFTLLLYLYENLSREYFYILAFILSLIFLYIFKLLNKFLSSDEFLKNLYSYNPKEAKEIFIKKISSEIRLGKLIVSILAELEKTFQAQHMAILLINSKEEKIISETYKSQKWQKSPLKNQIKIFTNLSKYINHSENSIIYIEEIDKYINESEEKYKNVLENTRRFMRENEVKVIVSLNKKIQHYGFIILGRKKDGEAYDRQDFEFLESILAFTSIAIQNSLSHKELLANLGVIKDFNKTLQTKVKQATKELKEKILDLEEARRKEREMVDIMGHELRTPLSIMKINLDLFQKSNKKNKYLNRTKEALEREIILLETMISSIRIDENRTNLQLRDVNLVKSIKSSLAAFSTQAKKKNLSMKFNEPPNKILVYADKVKLNEVLDNLINNAIKYTQKGSIEIKIIREKNYVRISVKDSGRGIPKDEIKNLGKKFYRVEQYTNEERKEVVRPGGTGLGLYVSFGLIEAMGGTYDIESEEGEGSIFSFTVPKYQSQPKIKTNSNNVKNVFERLKL